MRRYQPTPAEYAWAPGASAQRAASLACAAGEVEVRAELAALVVVALAEEHEPVRLEELPEVDLGRSRCVLGSRACSNRSTASATSGIDVAELVDDEQRGRPGG